MSNEQIHQEIDIIPLNPTRGPASAVFRIVARVPPGWENVYQEQQLVLSAAGAEALARRLSEAVEQFYKAGVPDPDSS